MIFAGKKAENVGSQSWLICSKHRTSPVYEWTAGWAKFHRTGVEQLRTGAAGWQTSQPSVYSCASRSSWRDRDLGSEECEFCQCFAWASAAFLRAGQSCDNQPILWPEISWSRGLVRYCLPPNHL